MFRSKEARLVFAILTLVMLAISLLVAVRFVLSAGMLIIVSGNADTSTTAVILILEITALMYSGFGMYQITSVVEKSKKK